MAAGFGCFHTPPNPIFRRSSHVVFGRFYRCVFSLSEADYFRERSYDGGLCCFPQPPNPILRRSKRGVSDAFMGARSHFSKPITSAGEAMATGLCC